RADGRRARDLDADLARDGRGFDVEVEHDLEVIGDEAYRRDDGLAHAVGREAAQRFVDVRPEPLLASVGRVVALIDEVPALMLERVADEPAAFLELRLVTRAARHR